MWRSCRYLGWNARGQAHSTFPCMDQHVRTNVSEGKREPLCLSCSPLVHFALWFHQRSLTCCTVSAGTVHYWWISSDIHGSSPFSSTWLLDRLRRKLVISSTPTFTENLPLGSFSSSYKLVEKDKKSQNTKMNPLPDLNHTHSEFN